MFNIVATKRGESKIFHTTHYYKAQMPLACPDCLCVFVVALYIQRWEACFKKKKCFSGNEESGQPASFLPIPGSYFSGLSSGSFKWGLVTAGTSWTKLLLPEPLLCCSHSALIGFDCICLNPQWKKEKGGWRCRGETEVCQLVQTWWHFRKLEKKRGPTPSWAY